MVIDEDQAQRRARQETHHRGDGQAQTRNSWNQ
jgi:hypothetical protein